MGVIVMIVGVGLVGAGLSRARRPWARYQELRSQDQNIARYEAWRGGVRNDGQTGASVAMAVLRRQAQTGAAIAVAGICLVVVGLAIR